MQYPPPPTVVVQQASPRRRGCLGGCGGVAVAAILIFILIAVNGGGTHTGSVASPTREAATATSAVAATATTSATATPIPTATTVPQIVVVIDNPVNVRESASADAPSFATLDPGTQLSVLGPDTTGADGATRWVHVAANGRDGYVRSDLVSAPQAYVPATATITALGPTVAPAVGPKPTAVAPATVAKGSGAPVRVGSGNLFVVLYRYFDPAPVGNTIGPPAGSRVVAFDIEVENRGRSPQSYNALYAYLKDTNNRRYDVNFFGSDIAPQLTSGTNQPGESTRGWVVFVIPSNAAISQIGYEDLFTGQRIVFNYSG